MVKNPFQHRSGESVVEALFRKTAYPSPCIYIKVEKITGVGNPKYKDTTVAKPFYLYDGNNSKVECGICIQSLRYSPRWLKLPVGLWLIIMDGHDFMNDRHNEHFAQIVIMKTLCYKGPTDSLPGIVGPSYELQMNSMEAHQLKFTKN